MYYESKDDDMRVYIVRQHENACCWIRIDAYKPTDKDEKLGWGKELYISVLTHPGRLYLENWWNRIKVAWKILRGEEYQDDTFWFDKIDRMHEFQNDINDAVAWLERGEQ
jgi:hypothetical protein